MRNSVQPSSSRSLCSSTHVFLWRWSRQGAERLRDKLYLDCWMKILHFLHRDGTSECFLFRAAQIRPQVYEPSLLRHCVLSVVMEGFAEGCHYTVRVTDPLHHPHTDLHLSFTISVCLFFCGCLSVSVEIFISFHLSRSRG